MNAKMFRPLRKLLLSMACAWMRSSEAAMPNEYVAVPTEMRRYALVIGVEHYRDLPAVKNANNDARGVADALLHGPIPFNGVRYLQDVETGDEIRSALDELKKAAQPDIHPTLIVIYFAGHGYQYESVNFIAPRLTTHATPLVEGVAVSELIDAVSTGNVSVGLVIIDACRENQDTGNGNLTIRNANVAGGFNRMDGGKDSIYVFSAAANRLASSQSGHDGLSMHSPFSGPLVKTIGRESLSVMRIFEEVSSSMAQEPPIFDQTPVWGSALSPGNVVIFPARREMERENASWQKVVSSGYRLNCVKDYLTRFPIGAYSESALFVKKTQSTNIGGERCSVISE